MRSDHVVDRKEVFSAVETHGEQPTYTSSGTPYSVQPFLRLFEKMNGTADSKHDKDSPIISLIQSLSKAHARRFFSGLKTTLECVLSEEDFIPEAALEPEESDEHGGKRSPSASTNTSLDCEVSDALKFLGYATRCVQAYLDATCSRRGDNNASSVTMVIVGEAYSVAAGLHGILLTLSLCGSHGVLIQNEIMCLCESWWHASAGNREELIVQCLPLLVLKTLESENSKKNQAKRLFRLADAFDVIDFSHPSSDSLRDLLLRLVSNPICLKMTEGKRFLACMLLDATLVPDLHSAIRAQVPEASKRILESYGEIYLRAWRDSKDKDEDPQRSTLELHVLQDLVHTLIHVASTPIFQSLMTIVDPFHQCKKGADMQALLYRLYSPILWRSLTAANYHVRIHAISVLAEVFPLQDPSQNHMQVAVAKGTAALKIALEDPDPRVRIAASEATAKICGVFWNALPTNDIRELLNQIVLKHASDKKSAPVRRSALRTVAQLLDVPESRAVLRPLLPFLGNLIHDKSQTVRLAAVQLLHHIKRVKSIKFYHIVPVDQLATRLCEEEKIHRSLRSPVASALSSLLLNSYFPQGAQVSATDQLKRSLTFMATEPDSATVFFANATEHLSTQAVIKLATMFVKCLISSVKVEQEEESRNSHQKGKKRVRLSDQEKMNTTQTSKGDLSASNTALMATMSGVIHLMLDAIEKAPDDSQDLTTKANLYKCFDGTVLKDLVSHFHSRAAVEYIENNDGRIASHASDSDSDADDGDQKEADENPPKRDCIQVCGALILCAAKLPSEASNGLAAFVSSNVNLAGSQVGSTQALLIPYISLLCCRGKTSDVVDEVASSINKLNAESISIDLQSPAYGKRSKRRSTKKCKKRNSEFNSMGDAPVVPHLPPKVALHFLHTILISPDSMCASIRSSFLSSRDTSDKLKSALEGTVKSIKNVLTLDALKGCSGISDVEVLLWTWECYGRFLLHRQAANDGMFQLDDDTREFFDWTNEHILAILDDNYTEPDLCNLDLSRISNASDSLMIFSPSNRVPFQRNSIDQSTTREWKQATAANGGDGEFNENEATSSKKIAMAILQSACLLFSEWLAVDVAAGGSVDGILGRLSQWSSIMKSDCEEVDNPCRSHLFEAFIRIAYLLCKRENSTMLAALLAYDVDSDHAKALVEKTVSRLILKSSKPDSSIVKKTLAGILQVAKLSVPDVGELLEPGTWENGTALIAPAMSTLLGCESISAAVAQAAN